MRYYGKIHSKLPIFHVKSVKNYTGQFFLHRHRLWCLWQIWGMYQTLCSDFVMTMQDQDKVRNITRTSRENFWRKIMNAVPPISMATAKPHQKVCDLKIAIVHLHPFVFKKISDKSSALVPVLRANYLFKTFATCVTNKSYF